MEYRNPAIIQNTTRSPGILQSETRHTHSKDSRFGCCASRQHPDVNWHSISDRNSGYDEAHYAPHSDLHGRGVGLTLDSEVKYKLHHQQSVPDRVKYKLPPAGGGPTGNLQGPGGGAAPHAHLQINGAWAQTLNQPARTAGTPTLNRPPVMVIGAGAGIANLRHPCPDTHSGHARAQHSTRFGYFQPSRDAHNADLHNWLSE